MVSLSTQLASSLHDLLADLTEARHRDDLGRLALLAYCDVRRWARQAQQPRLAELSLALVTGSPVADRDTFLLQVDRLIDEVHALVPGGIGEPAAALDARLEHRRA